MALQFVNVTSQDKELFPLVERAYEDVFVKEFPNADMEDDCSKILNMLEGGVDGVSAVVNLYVDDETPDLRPVGIAVGYYFNKAASGLLIYNAVDSGYRSQGLGKAFVKSRIDTMRSFALRDGKTLRGVFIDVKDPAKYDASREKMDPQLRIDIFKKWGAEIVPINYVLPPNTPDGPHDTKVLLMSYNIDGMKGGPGEVRDFISAFYHSELTQNGLKPSKDMELMRMMREIESWEKELAALKSAQKTNAPAPAPR